MHVLGNADHVWHGLHIDVPLDLQFSDSNPCKMSRSAHLIRQSAVRALRLDQTWRRRGAQPTRLTRIPKTDIVDQLQFIGQDYVLTLSQTGDLATFLTLWGINTTVVPRAVRIEIPRATRFSAILDDGQLVVATLSRNDDGKGWAMPAIHLFIFILMIAPPQHNEASYALSGRCPRYACFS